MLFTLCFGMAGGWNGWKGGEGTGFGSLGNGAHRKSPARSQAGVLEAVLGYLPCNCFCAAYFDYKDESGFPKPPSYNVATTLPSYDEAERTKAEATIPLVPGRVSVLACLAVPALLGTIAALTPAHHVPWLFNLCWGFLCF